MPPVQGGLDQRGCCVTLCCRLEELVLRGLEEGERIIACLLIGCGGIRLGLGGGGSGGGWRGRWGADHGVAQRRSGARGREGAARQGASVLGQRKGDPRNSDS